MTGGAAVVILAAGAGRRLGGVAKALIRIPEGGPTFLARVAATAGAAGAGPAVAVVGPPHGEAIAAEARRLGIDVAHNPDPERGMASSVAVGFAHAAEHFGAAAAALLWPVDHVRVSSSTVARLVAEADAGAIVVPTWGARGGHPTAFGRDLWAALARCAALPRGARTVIDRHGDVRRIEIADAGIVADVDRPDDLR